MFLTVSDSLVLCENTTDVKLKTHHIKYTYIHNHFTASLQVHPGLPIVTIKLEFHGTDTDTDTDFRDVPIM